MISCTEFIPSYSELFSYLDENKGGHAEVERFWTYLFEPTGKGIPLINFARKDGLRGCWNYWMGTLHEEAADCIKIINEKDGWIYSEMLYCLSMAQRNVFLSAPDLVCSSRPNIRYSLYVQLIKCIYPARKGIFFHQTQIFLFVILRYGAV